MDRRSFFTKKVVALLIAGLLILTAAVAFAIRMDRNETRPQLISDNRTTRGGEKTDTEFSKVILNVRGMSCSGCISTIKGALAGFQGIRDILVDISGGRVEIYYDKENLNDVTGIEKAITDSGYPAKIVKIFSPEEIRKERDLAASKAEYYIASVSGYDIARADFAIEMNAARKKFKKTYGDNLFNTAQGKALENNLKAQVASRLIEEGILLQEINQSKYRLSGDAVNVELKAYFQKNGKNEKEFKQSLEDSGYPYDYFKKKFESGLLINRYLDEKVLAAATTQYEKERVFASWFNNSKTLANVVYYDKDLERAVRNQSASGSCCAAK
ncbi:MAG: SurA N-terminal domain-containing protein [Proteobacteria bacterium]|nr:SurA N-terminal domain-containing protein [Pseudomonadota bacterium]